ncbi:UNVERIFIED_CONTAM: hypothetical protein Sradi_1572400 [Sesamum radiatum]|uniref:Uncharacterized protein n=1 Tax=Sesamum radiatum TaxID=300843 RepID=A0AAW2UAH3_SESRA
MALMAASVLKILERSFLDNLRSSRVCELELLSASGRFLDTDSTLEEERRSLGELPRRAWVSCRGGAPSPPVEGFLPDFP